MKIILLAALAIQIASSHIANAASGGAGNGGGGGTIDLKIHSFEFGGNSNGGGGINFRLSPDVLEAALNESKLAKLPANVEGLLDMRYSPVYVPEDKAEAGIRYVGAVKDLGLKTLNHQSCLSTFVETEGGDGGGTGTFETIDPCTAILGN